MNLEDMTDEEIRAKIESNNKKYGRKPKEESGNSFGDYARAAAQGLTLGFGDEIEAALFSALGPRKYEEVVKEIRSEMEVAEGLDPLGIGAAEVGGGLLTGGAGAIRAGGRLAAKKALKNMGQKLVHDPAAPAGLSKRALESGVDIAKGVGKSAGLGAGEGAVYAAGTGTEGDRLERAVAGAMQGAELGGIFGGAGSVASRFIKGRANAPYEIQTKNLVDKMQEKFDLNDDEAFVMSQRYLPDVNVKRKQINQSKGVDDPLSMLDPSYYLTPPKTIKYEAPKGSEGIHRAMFGDNPIDLPVVNKTQKDAANLGAYAAAGVVPVAIPQASQPIPSTEDFDLQSMSDEELRERIEKNQALLAR